MTSWVRFENGGKTGFGTLEGDMFDTSTATGDGLALEDVTLLPPLRSVQNHRTVE